MTIHRPLRSGHRQAFEIAKAYVESRRLSVTNISREDLVYLYGELRLPLDAIGQLIGRSDTRVRYLMHDFGIDRRDIGEARTGRYNTGFFKEWSPAMAWVLGLFFTDGCNHGSNISLASTDEEMLNKVQLLLGSDSALTVTDQPGKRIQRITLGHKEFRGDLERLGLTAKKSLNIEFPNTPAEYIRHFIRGCWDGDGGFTESSGKMAGHYTCGSEKFIKTIANELFKAGVCRKILRKNSSGDFLQMRKIYGDGPYPLTVYQRSASRAFDLRIGTDDQLAALYEFFYKGVDESVYLSRKHDKLATYLTLFRKIGDRLLLPQRG